RRRAASRSRRSPDAAARDGAHREGRPARRDVSDRRALARFVHPARGTYCASMSTARDVAVPPRRHRRIHVAGVGLALIVALATASPSAVQADPPGSGWTMVLSDDFDAPPGSLPDAVLWAPCPAHSCGLPPGRLSHYAISEGLLDHFDGHA